MAKMYGAFDRTHQNSKGWTKAAMRHDEERQIEKDVRAEEVFDQDCLTVSPLPTYWRSETPAMSAGALHEDSTLGME